MCYIIAKLLTLNDEEQEDYIISLAIKKNIIQKLSSSVLENSVFSWNNKFEVISSILAPQGLSTILGLDINKFSKTSVKYFNSMVNSLVYRNIGQKSDIAMPYQSFDQKFDDELNLQEIEIFSEKLIQHNYGKVIVGEIRINDNDFREGFIRNDGDNQDIYISSIILRQCAMHGDIVKVFAFNKKSRNENRNIDGFVMKIIKPINNRLAISRFTKMHDSFWLMQPKTGKIPCIRIEKEELVKWQNLSQDIRLDTSTLYLIKIIHWEVDVPHGSIIKTIGKYGTFEAENKSILAEFGIQQNIFSDSIMNSIPPTPFIIPQIEYVNRENLTKDCVITIDPETAKDLDDALSLKILKNGNYELGVHISDVTYFISENSELDNTIKQQATSIYMVDAVYHMLPKSLCMICSLLPGIDKLTCSVFWEIAPNGSILNTRFGKTIINSCAQLSYLHAQNIIDDNMQKQNFYVDDKFPKIHNNFTILDIYDSISKMHKIASIFREKRFENGSLSINMPKIQFELDNTTGRPVGINTYKVAESNFMIEEFMILANTTVAKHIQSIFPKTSLLRKHDGPDSKMISDLSEFLNKLGYQVNFKTSKSIAESMHQIITTSENSCATKCALSQMLAKPMVRAE